MHNDDFRFHILKFYLLQNKKITPPLFTSAEKSIYFVKILHITYLVYEIFVNPWKLLMNLVLQDFNSQSVVRQTELFIYFCCHGIGCQGESMT